MTGRLDRRRLLAAAAWLPFGACARAETAATAAIALGPGQPGRRVPPELFGTNLQWTSLGDGALIAGAGGETWNPTLIRLVREAGLSVLRFPGGALANTYRWRDGIGPKAGRGQGLDFLQTPQPSAFGSDELIGLLGQTGMRALITANASAGPEEAADWVEYLNGAASTPLGALRQSNTGAGPVGARWWEVGNELYSPKEPGTRTAQAYAATVAQFRQAMKRRDPAVKVGAMLEGSFQSAAWMRSVMPQLTTWNEEVLQACAQEIDFVSLHFSAPHDTLWSDADLRELTLAGSLLLKRTIHQVSAQLQAAGGGGLPILLTEYTAYYGGNPSARIAGAEGALFDALVLMEAMRQPSVEVAANWSLLNNSAFGLIAGDGEAIKPRPAYHTIKALRPLAGLPLMPLSIAGPSYAVAAKGSIPAMAEVPLVDGVAVAVSPGVYRLALVNRSARAAVPARLNGLAILQGALRSEADGALATATALTPGSADLTLPPACLAVLDAKD